VTQVVDSSVLVAALVDDGEDGRWSEISIGRDALVAPELLLVESSNILRRLERAGIISNIEANAAHSDLLQLDVELFPFAPFAERVWALRGNLTGYDAWYVAVAERFECPLLTLDRKLSRATGPICEFLIP